MFIQYNNNSMHIRSTSHMNNCLRNVNSVLTWNCIKGTTNLYDFWSIPPTKYTTRGASLLDYRYIKRFYYFSQLIIQYTNLFIDK